MVHQGLKRLGGRAILATCALVVFLGCASWVPPTSTLTPTPAPAPPAAPPPLAEPPAAPREFRAAWVATVANIDWPSSRGLSTAVQQAEARALVAQARALGLNALILQVRPAADALYASDLEPWSEYLTGEQGRPPEPAYDPLAFWIEEAHRAGLELHAWFNPYRARHASSRSPLAANHVGVTHPEWVKAYGDQLWLDPGEPAALEHSLAVVLDVARRYDLDGVHIDDYFYPYAVKDPAGQKVDFPDEPSWRAFLAAGGGLTRADWRRRNVDAFVERFYREVHRAKPQVRVGVSPFGLGRPDRLPPDVKGFSQYDELYANVELWLEQGWLDYLAPQLYWKMSSTSQPFSPLLDYWLGQNPKGRHVWPGLFTSQAGSAEPWPPEEVTGQIQLTRSRGATSGHAHFSMVALKKDFGGIARGLASTYGGHALVPATPWLGGMAPPTPSVRLRKSTEGSAVQVDLISGEPPCLLAIWGRYGDNWHFFTIARGIGTIPMQVNGNPLGPAFASAVGRTGLESARAPVKLERY